LGLQPSKKKQTKKPKQETEKMAGTFFKTPRQQTADWSTKIAGADY
jgi:hypothetical protein